jgi:hypothetical protein
MAGFGTHVIWHFEDSGRVMKPLPMAPIVDRLAAIRAALEAAGVEFTNGDAPGVRLRASS